MGLPGRGWHWSRTGRGAGWPGWGLGAFRSVLTLARAPADRRLARPLSADELVNEKEKYKGVADEMDTAFAELSGY